MPDRPKPSPPAVDQPGAHLTRGQASEQPTENFDVSLVGRTFDDFELLAELGRGGMGVVYKAWQKSLEREVALKLLLTEHASKPPLLQRFLAEARAAARLTHPNIISIYQVGECLAGPYFVMEFIDGPSLEQLLDRTLPVSWSVALLITVAEAVQHAHDKGTIHRDLKPANVMLHQQKRPIVLDFGLARVMGKGTGMTDPGTVVGTPAYMSPEQAGAETDRIGPHSDVYSLGAILYTLLTGKAPFEGGTTLRTIRRVISPDPPVPVRRLRPEVPPRLEQVCLKCLEKDPGKRYPSAQALAGDLQRFRAAVAKGPPESLRASMPSVLLVAPGGQQVRLFNPKTVIGRAPECDLVVKASEVSKRHCRIVLGPEEVLVEDLGSSNGTFVNGEQVQRAELQDGDELDLGGHTFQVRLSRPGAK
jgi:serine/threonine protein kinase